MHQRSRLDLPALVDPVVRDLLQESDTFARSFTGMGGFGLISPLDFVRILTLLSEVFAHVFILLSLTRSSTHLCILALSLVSSLLPLVDVAAWLGVRRQGHDDVYSPAEARAMAKQEQMRNLVYNESYRSEILVFGLSSWILESWASARRTMLGIEQSQPAMNLRHIVSTLVTQINFAEMLALLHNVSTLPSAQKNFASSCGRRYHYFYSYNHLRRHWDPLRYIETRYFRSFLPQAAWCTPYAWPFKASSSQARSARLWISNPASNLRHLAKFHTSHLRKEG